MTMGKLLDLATVKFSFRFSKNLLAIITLNWQDEFEVRYCRLSFRKNGSLWFQPPALKEFGWVKCFIVNDNSEWKELEEKVIRKFYEELPEQEAKGEVPAEISEKLHLAQEQKITDEDLDKITEGIDRNTDL